MVVDRLAVDVGGRFSTHRARADVLTGRLGMVGGRPGPRVVLAKPQSWMNESGGPVSGLVRFFHVPLDRLLSSTTTSTCRSARPAEALGR
jgi:PTH1 family peptidyl-tRNA hydrolase